MLMYALFLCSKIKVWEIHNAKGRVMLLQILLVLFVVSAAFRTECGGT